MVNFHPHVHVLADGVFGPDGTFVSLPPVPEELLREGFRQAVLQFLAKEWAISEELRSRRRNPRLMRVSEPLRRSSGHAQDRAGWVNWIDFPIPYPFIPESPCRETGTNCCEGSSHESFQDNHLRNVFWFCHLGGRARRGGQARSVKAAPYASLRLSRRAAPATSFRAPSFRASRKG